MASRNPGDIPDAEGDEPNGLNVRDEEYDIGVPGVMNTYNFCWGISPLTPLNSNKDIVIAALNKMRSNRETYIPAGLAWGWRILSSQAPFSEGAAYSNEAVRKVIVLMTDGSNTISIRDWSNKDNWIHTNKHDGEVWIHEKTWGNAKTEANNYTRALCKNIKAKGVMIYTIGFEIEGESDTEALMRECAGNGGMYYDADDETQLADAFRKIGQSLLNLRLTH
jgi:hypothetical protein